MGGLISSDRRQSIMDSREKLARKLFDMLPPPSFVTGLLLYLLSEAMQEPSATRTAWCTYSNIRVSHFSLGVLVEATRFIPVNSSTSTVFFQGLIS